MKINFKQPKYIIPILALPFLLLFYYIFSSWGGSGKSNLTAADSAALRKGTNAINTDMPGVSKEIADQNLKDKFEAYQEAYKYNKDYSALNGIDPNKIDGNTLSDLQSNYTAEDIQRIQSAKKLDSLNNILKSGQRDIDRQMAAFTKSNPATPYNNSLSTKKRYLPAEQMQRDPILEQLARINNSANSQANKTQNSGSTYDDQMKLFRDQMAMMDSMQHEYNGTATAAAGNKKNNRLNNGDPDKFDPTRDTTFKPLHISITKGEHGKFNTVFGFAEQHNIIAIIDEEIKATLGSRVRIRLLTDIFAGNEYHLPKGTYIYGVVTGFQSQRINISISQLFYNNTPIPVKLDVFDNDGYLGLYVPGSNFRELSKEIGTQGTNGLSSVQSSDNSNIVTGLATQLFQKTTTTVASLIKKDKALLKYNYIIYLKEKN